MVSRGLSAEQRRSPVGRVLQQRRVRPRHRVRRLSVCMFSLALIIACLLVLLVQRECLCWPPFEGMACQRNRCFNDCNGRGQCLPQKILAELAGRNYSVPWDAMKLWGCVCDKGYRGPDCSQQVRLTSFLIVAKIFCLFLPHRCVLLCTGMCIARRPSRRVWKRSRKRLLGKRPL